MSKKRMNQKKNSGSKRHSGLWALVVLLAAILAVLLAFIWKLENQSKEPELPIDQTTTAPINDPTGESVGETTTAPTTAPTIQIEIPEDVTMPLTHGLRIGDVGSYTGLFFEDGSDEVVSGVMMILVTNESDRTLQYAEITLTNDEGEQAQFKLSTLPPGASAVVLEMNRLRFAKGYGNATASNVAFFPEEPTLHEDKLKIQAYEGALNITNISDADIEGDIQIFYKNSASDVYYGGITYTVRIKGGLKAGQLQQLVPSHFNANGSTVMFIVMP